MRAFFCLEIPKRIQNEMAKLSEEISQPAYVKWVNSENLHITLKFLGEIESGQLPKIKETAHEVTTQLSGFDMNIDKLGSFPSQSYPKVVWLGSSSEPKKIHRLHDRLETDLENMGFSREDRDYVPHVTLGRTKEKNDRKIKDFGKKIGSFSMDKCWNVKVDELTLMKSDLRRSGPVYTPVVKLPLNGESK